MTTASLPALLRRFMSSAHHRSHEARADLLIDLLKPAAGISVLDLGSGWGDPFIRRVARRVPLRVTLADICGFPHHDVERLGYRAVHLKEGERLPFGDNEFDIVVSNSVIEHVTVSKEECLSFAYRGRDWTALAMRNQMAFAEEIRRVGKKYFVQTPHRDFPFDLHLWLPFTNWLSHDHAQQLVRFTDRFWVKKTGVADWNLLRPSQMHVLFPDGGIHVERFLGIPKSIIAYST